MTDYDKLKSIIQQANPEIIKRLKNCPDCGEYIGYDRSTKMYFCPQCPLLNSDKTEKVKVGRPIRLADVLLAIEKNLRGHSYFIDSQGGLHEWFAPKGQLDLRTVSQWNLKDDNLDHQSDETKQFLIDLLIK